MAGWLSPKDPIPRPVYLTASTLTIGGLLAGWLLLAHSGLVRTEFLFYKDGIPDEDTQYRAYRRIVEWAAPRPVTLRTLDAGGDKPIPGLTIDGESNPFLGTRGIRLCLARPDIFRVQLRAMARAAVHGNARIMLPMVTVPEEIDRAFDRFWRSGDGADGFGLGLPIVRRLVQTDRGEIELRPREAGGLEAVVRLQRAVGRS